MSERTEHVTITAAMLDELEKQANAAFDLAIVLRGLLPQRTAENIGIALTAILSDLQAGR